MKEFFKMVKYKGELYKEIQIADSPDRDKKYIILLKVDTQKTFVVEKDFFELNFQDTKQH